jgi:hypothetical protein
MFVCCEKRREVMWLAAEVAMLSKVCEWFSDKSIDLCLQPCFCITQESSLTSIEILRRVQHHRCSSCRYEKIKN